MIWQELRRRKMLRTCAVYVASCWLLLRAADMLIPVMGYEPGNIPRYLLYGCVALLPLVILLSWFYRVSPEGIHPSDDFVERRLLENIEPLNDRRGVEGVELEKSTAAGGHDWEITAESGALEGLRYAIARPLLIGRAKDCDLALVSAHVSRHHARLTPRGDTLLLEDLGSANGTLVNDETVSGQRTLHPGDVIRIRDISFRVSESYSHARGPQAAMNQATVVKNTPPNDSGPVASDSGGAGK